MNIDLSKEADVPCDCEAVSLFAASLVPQDWMVSKDHVPATLCRCGRNYHSWKTGKSYAARPTSKEVQS